MLPDPNFWSKVAIADSGSCWEWKLALNDQGYGVYCPPGTGKRGKRVRAHRYALGLALGRPVADGMDTDHLCRNRACVNPAHLEEVTHRENMLRGETVGAKNASRTHCPSGHPYDDRNTGTRPDRKRYCRECARLRMARRRADLTSDQASAVIEALIADAEAQS